MLHALRRQASLVVIFLIAVTAGLATLQLRGAEAFMTALWHAWELFLFIVPSLVAGLLLAAALRQLLSPDALARLMGAESGIFGLFIATLVGTLSPGGPMAAFPLVLVLAGAGADRGALVAFILAWSLNGFQKLLVYEAPLLGLDFALLRTLITFPMPMIAGGLARCVPKSDADCTWPRRAPENASTRYRRNCGSACSFEKIASAGGWSTAIRQIAAAPSAGASNCAGANVKRGLSRLASDARLHHFAIRWARAMAASAVICSLSNRQVKL